MWYNINNYKETKYTLPLLKRTVKYKGGKD